MVKISISLPNNAQITFESEEPEVLHEVVGIVLRDLPKELMRPSQSTDGATEGIVTNGTTEKSTKAITPTQPAEKMTMKPTARVETQTPIPETNEPENLTKLAISEITNTNLESDRQAVSLQPAFLSDSDCVDFKNFCRNANPIGDMRRVVVAAVGANRHLGVDGVNADDLWWLFDAAGWRKPDNFTQTLRNAARSKFGWLERIPGRSGRYAATPIGISKTLTSD